MKIFLMFFEKYAPLLARGEFEYGIKILEYYRFMLRFFTFLNFLDRYVKINHRCKNADNYLAVLITEQITSQS